jgi:acyl-CoA thioester hydrolase
MGRIQLEFSGPVRYGETLRLGADDVSRRGHLGHDRLVWLLNRLRPRFFARLGFDEAAIDGGGLILADLALVCRSEAFAGEELAVEVAVGEVSRKGLELLFRVTARTDDRPVALAKAGMVLFDYRRRRAMELPAALRQALTEGPEFREATA